MSSTLLAALLSPLNTVAESTPVPNPEVPSTVDGIWQKAWSTTEGSKEGSGGDQQVEPVKGVLEVVSRDLTVGPLSDGTVSYNKHLPVGRRADSGQLFEPSASSSVDEKQAFQDSIQYRLDIVLALFESSYATLQSQSLLQRRID